MRPASGVLSEPWEESAISKFPLWAQMKYSMNHAHPIHCLPSHSQYSQYSLCLPFACSLFLLLVLEIAGRVHVYLCSWFFIGLLCRSALVSTFVRGATKSSAELLTKMSICRSQSLAVSLDARTNCITSSALVRSACMISWRCPYYFTALAIHFFPELFAQLL